jgi:hypothetical protein
MHNIPGNGKYRTREVEQSGGTVKLYLDYYIMIQQVLYEYKDYIKTMILRPKNADIAWCYSEIGGCSSLLKISEPRKQTQKYCRSFVAKIQFAAT